MATPLFARTFFISRKAASTLRFFTISVCDLIRASWLENVAMFVSASLFIRFKLLGLDDLRISGSGDGGVSDAAFASCKVKLRGVKSK